MEQKMTANADVSTTFTGAPLGTIYTWAASLCLPFYRVVLKTWKNCVASDIQVTYKRVIRIEFPVSIGIREAEGGRAWGPLRHFGNGGTTRTVGPIPCKKRSKWRL